jgi:uncharacterized protein
MEIKYFTNANDFLSLTADLLGKDEVCYGLILGIAKRLVDNPHTYGQTAPWFCVVKDGRKIVAAAMRTPPYNVILAHFSGDSVAIVSALVESISKRSETIPGVVGDKAVADLFVEAWCAAHGPSVKSKMAQRIYRLDKINDIPFASGKLRLATLEDKELVIKWGHSFNLEADPSSPEGDIIPKIERREVYLWEDGMPVSMAGKARTSDKSVRISLVYTPVNFRHKGYATSCVAALCQELLASGYQFCMLYTDLANPTSNSIYQKIGFKAVCDSVEYSFQ